METKRILHLLVQSFDGHAWHGPTVMEALAGMNSDTASARIGTDTHSIHELVLHIAAWRNFVEKKLTGIEFEMTEELNFPKPGSWDSAISSLRKSQSGLVNALVSFPESRLGDLVPGRNYDFYTLLHGIIQHDIYHAGQIMIIKKSLSTP